VETLYMGREVGSLSREELIEAVIDLGRQLDDAHNRHAATLEAWRGFQRKRAYAPLTCRELLADFVRGR
jgi:hypothetical protein